jgi:hypothetical protein
MSPDRDAPADDRGERNMSPPVTEEHLQKRPRRASRAKYEAALAQVPDVEPDEHDRL